MNPSSLLSVTSFPCVEIPCADGVRKVWKGYRFTPRDDELVKYYLLNKAHRLKLPCEIIPSLELSSFDPDQFPINEFTFLPEKESYAFLYNEAKQYPASKGTWEMVGDKVEVYDWNNGGGTDLIGYKTTFEFRWGEDADSKESAKKYIMNEYSLNAELSTNRSDDADIQKNVENLVLCKVQEVEPDTSKSEKTLSKKKKKKFTSAGKKINMKDTAKEVQNTTLA